MDDIQTKYDKEIFIHQTSIYRSKSFPALMKMLKYQMGQVLTGFGNVARVSPLKNHFPPQHHSISTLYIFINAGNEVMLTNTVFIMNMLLSSLRLVIIIHGWTLSSG
jgi:hypothetical protein